MKYFEAKKNKLKARLFTRDSRLLFQWKVAWLMEIGVIIIIPDMWKMPK
jgi:hypothetical protein